MARFGPDDPEPEEPEKPPERPSEPVKEEKPAMNDEEAAAKAQAEKDAFKAKLAAMLSSGPPKKPG